MSADYNGDAMEDASRIAGAAMRAEWTRVIVLAPDASAAPGAADSDATSSETRIGPTESLKAEFERRDWFAIVQNDPYQALAELALREQAQIARAAWGLQRMEGLALLVIEPGRWPGDMLAPLLDAVRRCVPQASIWTARDDRIEPVPSAESARLAPAPPSEPSWEPSKLRLRSAHAAQGGSIVESAARDVFSTTPAIDVVVSNDGRLSREEIDMLLHDGEFSEGPVSGPEAKP